MQTLQHDGRNLNPALVALDDLIDTALITTSLTCYDHVNVVQNDG
jgi:hypothetical protein